MSLNRLWRHRRIANRVRDRGVPEVVLEPPLCPFRGPQVRIPVEAAEGVGRVRGPRMYRPQADIAVLVAAFVVVAESIAPSLSRLFVGPALGRCVWPFDAHRGRTRAGVI